MARTTVRITEATHRIVKELAAKEGLPLQAVLDRAVEQYRRRRFFEELDAGYATGRETKTSVQEELSAWDQALPDGLDTELASPRAPGRARPAPGKRRR